MPPRRRGNRWSKKSKTKRPAAIAKKVHPGPAGDLIGRPSVQEMTKSLECPICLSVPLAPIYTCGSGHIICGKCKPHVKKCTCKKTYGTARNYAMEDMVSKSLFKCRNEGCNQITSGEKMEAHLATCEHDPDKVKAEPDAVLASDVGLLQAEATASAAAPISNVVPVLANNVAEPEPEEERQSTREAAARSRSPHQRASESRSPRRSRSRSSSGNIRDQSESPQPPRYGRRRRRRRRTRTRTHYGGHRSRRPARGVCSRRGHRKRRC